MVRSSTARLKAASAQGYTHHHGLNRNNKMTWIALIARTAVTLLSPRYLSPPTPSSPQLKLLKFLFKLLILYLKLTNLTK